MVIEYALLSLFGALVMFLLVLLMKNRSPGWRAWLEALSRRGLGQAGGRQRGSRPPRTVVGPEKIRSCPLCRQPLEAGQFVKSAVFSGGTKNRSGSLRETMSHLFGCPHCWPPNDRHARICPYCRNEVPRDGYVVARYFENRETSRKHIHVLGCTGCRRTGIANIR